MIIGNSQSFGIGLEWLPANSEYFLTEDQQSAAKLFFFVGGKSITGEQVINAPAYSLALWMNDHYNEVLDVAGLPLSVSYKDDLDLIEQLSTFVKESSNRTQASSVKLWLESHTLSGSDDANLPTITFVYTGGDTVGVVWFNGSKGCAKVPILDVKYSFKYFIIATAIHFRSVDTKTRQLLLSRWR